MGLGHYPLRLPSYRSAHGRRYHPYPAVRRHANNDEFYMDPIPDFDFEAAEHMLDVPPSLQLHPVRREDDDDDVTAFALDGSTTKDAKKMATGAENKVVVVVDKRRAEGGELKSTMAKPSSRLTTLYTLFLFLRYAQDLLTKGRLKASQQSLRK